MKVQTKGKQLIMMDPQGKKEERQTEKNFSLNKGADKSQERPRNLFLLCRPATNELSNGAGRSDEVIWPSRWCSHRSLSRSVEDIR